MHRISCDRTNMKWCLLLWWWLACVGVAFCGRHCYNIARTIGRTAPSALVELHCKLSSSGFDFIRYDNETEKGVVSVDWTCSKENCSTSCKFFKNCHSAVFIESKAMCILSAAQFEQTSWDETVTTRESTSTNRRHSVYTTEVTTPKEKSCKETCTRPNYRCYGERCECKPTLCKKPDGECVSNCHLFSNSFSLQYTNRCSKNYYEEFDISTEEQCQQECINYRPAFCAAFQFWNGKCQILGRRKSWPRVQWVDKNECRFYQRNCEPYQEEMCGNCDGPGYRCDKGRCVCNYGYSYFPRNKVCVKACNVFANEFTLQSKRICKDTYLELIDSISLYDCQNKCTFQVEGCSAFEYYAGDCYIITNTLNASRPWEDWNSCDHYQRNCKECPEVCTELGKHCIGGKCVCKNDHRQLPSGECVKVSDVRFQNLDDKCDVECPLPKYMCKDNNCTCNYGYSLLLRRRLCVEECAKYGTSFKMYYRHICLNGYTLLYAGVHRIVCRKLCLRHATCYAYEVDLFQKDCYLLLLPVDPKLEFKNYEDCRHFHRQCA